MTDRISTMFDSRRYWLARYTSADPGGWGSKGVLAAYKADFLRRLVLRYGVTSILELGCGDGEQLAVYDFGGVSYVGLDVLTAVAKAEERFRGDRRKLFGTLDDPGLLGVTADLTLSADVIYHLVEDDVWLAHMARLFDRSLRLVAIYAPDTDETPENAGVHCRFRRWSEWVERERPEWAMVFREDNPHRLTPENPKGSLSDFHVYARR